MASDTLQTGGLKHGTNLWPQARYKPKASDTLKPEALNTLPTWGLKHATNLRPQTRGPWATWGSRIILYVRHKYLALITECGP